MASERKPRGKRIRCGPGQFYWQGIAERQAFLEAIKRKAPRVIASLTRRVLPVYLELSQALPAEGYQEFPFRNRLVRLPRRSLFLPDVLFRAWFKDDSETLARFTPDVQSFVASLYSVLLEWADRYRINKPWIIEEALRVMEVGPDAAGKLSAWGSGLVSGGEYGPELRFRYEPWNPCGVLSLQKYRDRVRKAFSGVLNAHLAEVRRRVKQDWLEAKAEGRAKRLRRAAAAPPRQWIEWLVLWQCRGKSETEIVVELDTAHCSAEGLWTHVSTVRHGIKKAAECLDMTDILRSGTRGPRRRKPR
jgi:hypothetical protein